MSFSPEVLIYLQTVKNFFKSNEETRNYFISDSDEEVFFKHLCEISQKNFEDNGEVMLNKEQFELLRRTILAITISQKDIEEVVEEIIELPPEFVSLANKNVPLSARFALKYLYDRGFKKEDVVMWKAGCCLTGEYKNRIIIPSFNENGDVNYFIARSYTNDFPKYMNPKVSKDIVFNELYLDWNEDITIVEGVFDAMKAINAIPLLGSTLNQQSNLFRKIVQYDPKVYIALDPDAEKKASTLIQNLVGYDIELYKIDVCGYDDVGTMPKHVFLNRKERAEPIGEDWVLEHSLLAI
jgi:hypothetical protein